jgi:hypothetical protein
MVAKVKLPKELKNQDTLWKGIPEDWYEYYGFVYLVTNILNQKKYIGRKFFWRTVKGNVVGESDWRQYKSSSNNLLSDIMRLGMESFSFEVLSVHKTKSEVEEMEVGTQLTRNVLRCTLIDGSPEYYNNSINSRYYRPKEFGTPEYYAKCKAISDARKEGFKNGTIVSHRTGVITGFKGTKRPECSHHKNLGRKHTEETKLKFKQRTINREMFVCPHCKKEMTIQTLKKYHGDKCKKYGIPFVEEIIIQKTCAQCGSILLNKKLKYCCDDCKKVAAKRFYKYQKVDKIQRDTSQ